VAAPGSGPRHAAFVTLGDKTLLYLISELANTVTTYEVTPSLGMTSLRFTQIAIMPTHGEGTTVPKGASAAEILVTVSSAFVFLVACCWRSTLCYTLSGLDSVADTNEQQAGPKIPHALLPQR
jgi:6-phosphogluconolactonase (cycloisomerase 2 family)